MLVGKERLKYVFLLSMNEVAFALHASLDHVYIF